MNLQKFIATCFLSLVFVTGVSSELSNSPDGDLYLVLLIDGSLSMNGTDPDEYRKLASQAVVSLLPTGTKVAVVQYADRAELLLPWTDASDKAALFEGVNRISSTGTTDFLLGFRKTVELFEEVPHNARKIIFLFSDGELSPYPFSAEYSPFHLEYRRLIAGKSRPEIHKIYDEFRQRLAPIARAKIDSEVLPALQEQSIEIFSIAFSEQADQEFMNYLSRQTSLSEVEQRYFYVEQPTDLVEAFLAMLPYWQNKTLLYAEDGVAGLDAVEEVYIDEYLRNVFFIVFSEEPLEFTVNAKDNQKETPLEGTHPQMHIIPIDETLAPAEWEYKADGGRGSYKVLVLGESTLRIEVENLNYRYMFGEELEANVLLRVGDNDARPLLSQQPDLLAEILHEGGVLTRFNLEESEAGFALNYKFPHLGNYSVRLTLEALNAQGKAMLPRPSREYQMMVSPRFYVEPENIAFGSIKRGNFGEAEIFIQNGHAGGRIVEWSSNITGQSRELRSDDIPFIHGSVSVGSEQSGYFPVKIEIPKGRNWGNFEGIIELTTNHGETEVITFTVHVPSWIEKVVWFIVPILILLVVALLIILVKWSNLKSPVGILRPVDFPPGILLDDIRLGRLKRGLWSKYFNWKKNEIILGGPNSDVYLPGSDSQLIVRLMFYHFGSDYIRNESKDDSENFISVINPAVGLNIDLRSGRSYSLSNGLKVKIGEYTFTYYIS